MTSRKHRTRAASLVPQKRERQYKHVFESALGRLLRDGAPLDEARREAARIAAATVNKRRAALARGVRTCATKRGRTTCRTRRGPRLVGRGGSRRQWYPGKAGALGKRERFACLEHGRRFKTKSAWLSHLRSHAPRTVRGAGDLVERAASALGIRKCAGCERRRRWLNRKIPFGSK